MKAKAIRLPQDLLDAIKYAGERERIDEPTALRKVLRLGAERYVASLYDKGEISLRDASRVLALPVRRALELFADMGISGNVTAAQALKARERLKGARE